MPEPPKDLPHQYLMTLSLNVDARNSARIGKTPMGVRTIAPVSGGDFDGPRLRGAVLPGGADWVLMDSDRSFLIDVRLTLRTDDQALIYLSYEGRFRGDADAMADLANGKELAADRYSLAMTAKFECGDRRYEWLNSVIAVGTGAQSGFNPVYTLYEIG